jgi:hypothetical protein
MVIKTPSAGGRPTGMFSALLIYYWACSYLPGIRGDQDATGYDYYLYVVPISLFVTVAFSALMMTPGALSSKPVRLMLVFVAIVGSVAVVRGDFRTMANVGLLSLTVTVILAYRLRPSVTLLNHLFVASLLATTIAYAAHRSNYWIVPGSTLDRELWWRISVLPQIATGAFFAHVVLFANILRPGASLRRTCIVLSAYFLAFSGLRSALASAAFGGIYLLLIRTRLLSSERFRKAYLPAMLVVFVMSIYATEYQVAISKYLPNAINVLLFRAEDLTDKKINPSYRTAIWREHFRLAEQNPILGIGSFDSSVFAGEIAESGLGITGSEAFLTGLYARVGIPELIFILALFSAIFRGVKARDDLVMVMGVSIFIAMLTYGSIVNAYGFVFLVMVGLLVPAKRPGEQTRAPGDGRLTR